MEQQLALLQSPENLLSLLKTEINANDLLLLGVIRANPEQALALLESGRKSTALTLRQAADILEKILGEIPNSLVARGFINNQFAPKVAADLSNYQFWVGYLYCDRW